MTTTTPGPRTGEGPAGTKVTAVTGIFDTQTEAAADPPGADREFWTRMAR